MTERPDRPQAPENEVFSGSSDRAETPDDLSLEPMDSLMPPPVAALDSLDDDFLRQQLHAALFGGEQQGVWVDRFELLEKLGAGGMGSVWAAQDHRLRRRVALKFLRSHVDGSVGEQRLFREAQALARIAHPNVISVFDVGRHAGRVWIAMELVPGQTLREWAAASARSPRQILDVWITAGRGLAAIHEAGLVHRDVKPDNVMIGDDGRVRVVDFGLVRAVADLEPLDQPPTEATGSGAPMMSTQQVATTRGFVGTPAYAAPEQRAAEVVDALADQYAFCVSLWEALSGERPDKPAKLSSNARIPRRVHRALQRGLAEAPAQRFADMHALLAALAPKGRRWILPGLTAAVFVGVALGSVFADPTAAPANPCARAAEHADRVWTAVQRDAFGAQLQPEVAARGREQIDQWLERWRFAARESCEEVNVRHERSPAALDRRRACLDVQLRELSTLITTTKDGQITDATTLARWLEALDSPAACLLTSVVDRTHAATPEAIADEVAQIHAQLQVAQLGTNTRSLRDRLLHAQTLQARAVEIDWAPLHAEAARVIAELSRALGRADQARLAYGELFDHARASDDASLIADAFAGLTQVALELELDEVAASWAWERQRATLAQLGDDPPREAKLARQRGQLERLRGNFTAAEAALREAIASWQRAGSNHGWSLAQSMRQLAAIIDDQGRSDEALELFAEAAALERLVPPNVTLWASTYEDGVAAYNAGELAKAEGLLTTALAEVIAYQGPHGPEVGRVHIALSGLYDAQGARDKARSHAELADAIYVDAMGSDHPDRAAALTALGTAQFREGDFAAAAASYRRGLTIGERSLPADSSDLAIHQLNLGEALYELGVDTQAATLVGQAQATLAAELPGAHPVFALTNKILGALALRRGAHVEALEHLERAAEIHTNHPGNLVEHASVMWLLARACAQLGDTQQASVHADDARARFATLGSDWTDTVTEIDTWTNHLEPNPR